MVIGLGIAVATNAHSLHLLAKEIKEIFEKNAKD